MVSLYSVFYNQSLCSMFHISKLCSLSAELIGHNFGSHCSSLKVPQRLLKLSRQGSTIRNWGWLASECFKSQWMKSAAADYRRIEPQIKISSWLFQRSLALVSQHMQPSMSMKLRVRVVAMRLLSCYSGHSSGQDSACSGVPCCFLQCFQLNDGSGWLQFDLVEG